MLLVPTLLSSSPVELELLEFELELELEELLELSEGAAKAT